MDTAWKDRVLSLKYRTTESQDIEYRALVYAALNHCDYETAKVLMQTFTREEDYEVQECVVVVLESAQREVYFQVLLEELCRLINDALDWAIDLVGKEVHFNKEALISAALKAQPPERECLILLLSMEEVREFYEDAYLVVDALSVD